MKEMILLEKKVRKRTYTLDGEEKYIKLSSIIGFSLVAIGIIIYFFREKNFSIIFSLIKDYSAKELIIYFIVYVFGLEIIFAFIGMFIFSALYDAMWDLLVKYIIVFEILGAVAFTIYLHLVKSGKYEDTIGFLNFSILDKLVFILFMSFNLLFAAYIVGNSVLNQTRYRASLREDALDDTNEKECST